MNDQTTNIQWFPGHMTKTFRVIEKELRNVDIIIELLDARIPASSKNPTLAELTKHKPRILLLNKSDLADDARTKEWIDYYHSLGYGAIALSSKDRKCCKKVVAEAKNVLKDKLASRSEKGMTGFRIRAMVVGIPNVGKSTFINNVTGGAPTRVEDRPGVTRGKQWIILDGIELLDMPGVLWPKFEDQNTALKLAFTGSIKDDVLDIAEIAALLLGMLRDSQPEKLCERYKIDGALPEDNYELLGLIAKKRGMLLAKGELDIYRAAAMVLDELRGGKLGRVTLEKCEEL